MVILQTGSYSNWEFVFNAFGRSYNRNNCKYILKNSMFDMIITYITLIVFIGLTAYDTQKIKNAAESSIGYGDTKGKVALMGALTLYLDFINLFLTIVKLLGKRN